MIRITIIYDNEAFDKTLTPDWGFACKIEAHDHTILFDTGTKGDILMSNMEKLKISPEEFDCVMISHGHSDHAGGLPEFLKTRKAKVYVPASVTEDYEGADIERVAEPIEIFPGLHSTGELEDIEQSLVITQNRKTVVIVGCSHSGVPNILEAAAQFGPPSALIGGFHGFEEFEVLSRLDQICPTHCTQHIDTIKRMFPEKCIDGGAGKVIIL